MRLFKCVLYPKTSRICHKPFKQVFSNNIPFCSTCHIKKVAPFPFSKKNVPLRDGSTPICGCHVWGGINVHQPAITMGTFVGAQVARDPHFLVRFKWNIPKWFVVPPFEWRPPNGVHIHPLSGILKMGVGIVILEFRVTIPGC